MNGDLLYVDAWLGDGPTLAGLATRYVRLRRTREPAAPTSLEEVVFDECAGTVTTLCHLAGRELPFDGQAPYVGLDKWNQALKAEDLGRFDVQPLTHGYALTGHAVQGGQYRRETVLIAGDLRSRNFQKSTALPDGSQMPFSMRWIYTAISRATERAALVVSR